MKNGHEIVEQLKWKISGSAPSHYLQGKNAILVTEQSGGVELQGLLQNAEDCGYTGMVRTEGYEEMRGAQCAPTCSSPPYTINYLYPSKVFYVYQANVIYILFLPPFYTANTILHL